MQEVLHSLQLSINKMVDDFISSLPLLILGLVLFFSYLGVSSFLKKILVNKLKSKADDQLLLGFIGEIIQIINVMIAILLFLYAIGKTGIITSILGAAGVSAFIIGFAFKDIGENFLAGVIMAFNRPFRLGDTVMTNNVEGVIIELNLRDTMIKTFDGKDVSIPNGFIIKNPLFNYTKDGFLRNTATFTINSPEKSHLAIEIITTTVENIPGVLKEVKNVLAYIPKLNKNSADISVNYWINTYDTKYSSFDIKTNIYKEGVIALNNADISLDVDLMEIRNVGS